jgi:hypothetical protein
MSKAPLITSSAEITERTDDATLPGMRQAKPNEQAPNPGVRPIALSHLDAQSPWRAASATWAWRGLRTHQGHADRQALSLVRQAGGHGGLQRAVEQGRHAGRPRPGLLPLQLRET